MLKLIIADDEMLMRLAIRSLINGKERGIELIGEASNGKEAYDLALSAKPDLILTDIKMPIMDGLQLIRETSKALPNCKFAVLSNFDEFRYVREAMQLGAVDYLIKSEVSPAAVDELLNNIKRKLREDQGRTRELAFDSDYWQSLAHMKETLFKDLISGLLSEKEARAQAQKLDVRIRPERLTVVKLRMDCFHEVRKKYVEQDEKLLRFSIVNILEEFIPGKWKKEIVVENSAEYLLILNLAEEPKAAGREELEQLCAGIRETVKDFMNLSLSIGIGPVVSSFRELRMAYKRADAAMRRRFFEGTGHILFDEAGLPESANEQADGLPEEQVYAFLTVLEEGDEAKAIGFLDRVRNGFAYRRTDERGVREAYIRLAEAASACLSYRNRSLLASSVVSPFEALLREETLEGMHRVLVSFTRRIFFAEGGHEEQLSHAERAVQMIQRYYAEDISLQSVASQINVNPSYLSRVFKQEKGENFISYLTRVRIERAKGFLESRKYKVYEVADKVGYHNYTYFSKIFKKIVGVSPEEFRR